MLSESGLADDLYKMFHVWMRPLNGGLAVGTIALMVAIERCWHGDRREHCFA
jgi:hypothetical protein